MRYVAWPARAGRSGIRNQGLKGLPSRYSGPWQLSHMRKGPGGHLWEPGLGDRTPPTPRLRVLRLGKGLLPTHLRSPLASPAALSAPIASLSLPGADSRTACGHPPSSQTPDSGLSFAWVVPSVCPPVPLKPFHGLPTPLPLPSGHIPEQAERV